MGGRRATGRLGVPGVLGIVAVLAAVISAVGFAVGSPPASSTPEHHNAFNERYGTTGSKLDSCLTCHQTQAASKENLNPYGTDFAGAAHDFGAIEGKDSDGDGVPNLDEIKKGTFPGDPSDK
ncbi:MAG TPA: hypothetical protein VG795_10415 [Acidimicrobiia bacterium]|nr:hypothetical protein [Acidimicrobiia bacterium]